MVGTSAQVNLAAQLVERVKARHKRITVVGDAMQDCWVHGHLEDSQDGCQKFVQESYCNSPGGAANAASCLNGWIGIDADVHSFSLRHQCQKTRFVLPDGKIHLRWDDDVPTKIDDIRDGYNFAYNRIMEMVPFSGAVLISDYDKHFMTPLFIKDLVARCAHNEVPCVVDAKRDPNVYAGAVIKCNEFYFTKYRDKIPLGVNVIVTRGQADPFVDGADGTLSNAGAELEPVKCINHVGAGDCFAAHLALALAYGFSLRDAAAVAHSAGRVYVQYEHNRPPRPEEIVADMESVV